MNKQNNTKALNRKAYNRWYRKAHAEWREWNYLYHLASGVPSPYHKSIEAEGDKHFDLYESYTELARRYRPE